MQAGYSDVHFGTGWFVPGNVEDLRMNPVVRDAWIERLESGDYQQGQNQLVGVYREKLEHCCLGVLCELAVEAGVLRAEYRQQAYVAVFPDDHYAEYRSSLPEVVSRWAGLWTDDPVVAVDNGDRFTLSNCNDTRGMNFVEIARAIRRSL